MLARERLGKEERDVLGIGEHVAARLALAAADSACGEYARAAPGWWCVAPHRVDRAAPRADERIDAHLGDFDLRGIPPNTALPLRHPLHTRERKKRSEGMILCEGRGSTKGRRKSAMRPALAQCKSAVRRGGAHSGERCDAPGRTAKRTATRTALAENALRFALRFAKPHLRQAQSARAIACAPLRGALRLSPLG